MINWDETVFEGVPILNLFRPQPLFLQDNRAIARSESPGGRGANSTVVGIICPLVVTTDYGRPERKQPSLHGRKFTPTPKLYTPSTLNIDFIQWHTQSIMCAVK